MSSLRTQIMDWKGRKLWGEAQQHFYQRVAIANRLIVLTMKEIAVTANVLFYGLNIYRCHIFTEYWGASVTYVLRNGVGRLKWKIDRTLVANSYVNVLSPTNKTIFHCFGGDPENTALEFEGKFDYTGDYNNGIIAFLVLNATEEDGGNYRSVIDLTSKVVGSQHLVVFAPFTKPTILATRNANELVNSSVTLTCQMETRGTPPGHSIPVSYIWRRNGEVVENNTKYIVKHFELRISYLQRQDLADTFTCLAFNEYDVTSPESTALEISKYSMTPENISSPTILIAACIIISAFVLVAGLLYRKYKASLYTGPSRNGEDMAYHGVNRVLSGNYCTIDDEKLYDIRRRVKSEITVEANNLLSSDDDNKESPSLYTEGVMEYVMDGVKPDTDGYLEPAVSVLLNPGLEQETVKGNFKATLN